MSDQEFCTSISEYLNTELTSLTDYRTDDSEIESFTDPEYLNTRYSERLTTQINNQSIISGSHSSQEESNSYFHGSVEEQYSNFENDPISSSEFSSNSHNQSIINESVNSKNPSIQEDLNQYFYESSNKQDSSESKESNGKPDSEDERSLSLQDNLSKTPFLFDNCKNESKNYISQQEKSDNQLDQFTKPKGSESRLSASTYHNSFKNNSSPTVSVTSYLHHRDSFEIHQDRIIEKYELKSKNHYKNISDESNQSNTSANNDLITSFESDQTLDEEHNYHIETTTNVKEIHETYVLLSSSESESSHQIIHNPTKFLVPQENNHKYIEYKTTVENSSTYYSIYYPWFSENLIRIPYQKLECVHYILSKYAQNNHIRTTILNESELIISRDSKYNKRHNSYYGNRIVNNRLVGFAEDIILTTTYLISKSKQVNSETEVSTIENKLVKLLNQPYNFTELLQFLEPIQC